MCESRDVALTGTSTASRALVTMAIGDEAAGWLELSGPRFEAYAQRQGMDYVAIREKRIRHRIQWRKGRVNLHLEKFQLGPLLDRYERILYMDADILICPECPDLLRMVPQEALGVVEDAGEADAYKRNEEMAEMERRFGPLPRPLPAYFNAGVLALSRAHRELLRFDPARLAPGRWPDQTYLNFRSAADGLPRHYLDRRANFLPGNHDWADAAIRRSAWAVHYAGPAAKALMREDAGRP
jgi:hypothetical protein